MKPQHINKRKQFFEMIVSKVEGKKPMAVWIY